MIAGLGLKVLVMEKFVGNWGAALAVHTRLYRLYKSLYEWKTGVRFLVQTTVFSSMLLRIFITTSPLRHRQSESMTRSPVPKPPATTTYSPDPPRGVTTAKMGEGLAAGA
jgi:hypothetical protein